MIKFRVVLQRQPEKVYRKADHDTAGALKKCFRQLETNPFYLPGRIKRLQGYEGLWRYRIGGLRVIYEIDMKGRMVGIAAILPRGDVYKKI